MSPTDILQFLPEKIVEMHFPAPGPTTTIGKRKKITVPDRRQSFWIDVVKHKGRMRSALFTVATDLIAALLEGTGEWPLGGSSLEHRQSIWKRRFNLEMATLLFSNIMNAVDVEQIMDFDISGNDKARDWAEAFFCHAIDSKFRHRKQCAEKITQLREWQIRLRDLQIRDRVMDTDVEIEISILQGKIKEEAKGVNDNWKNNILATWKTDFLDSMTFELGMKDVPICSAFGAVVKPRRAIGIIDDDPQDEGNPFKSSYSNGVTELGIDDREEWDDDDFRRLKEVGEAWKRQKGEEIVSRPT